MKKEIEKRWLGEFDEMNRMTVVSYAGAAEKPPEARKKQVEDDLLAFFILAYNRGVRDAEDMTETAVDFTLTEMQNAIYSRIEGKTWAERADEHIQNADVSALQTLAATEYHRIYNQASLDAGAKIQAQHPALDLVKTWHTMLDDKVRDTHKYLENISLAVTDDFYTYDGDHASSPGNFAKAENNAGCRCILDLHFQNATP